MVTSMNDKNERKELIKFNGNYFLVSRVNLSNRNNGFEHLDYLMGYNSPDSWETMIFPANESGEVTSWFEEYYHGGYETIVDSVTKFIGANNNLSDVEGDLD